MIPTQGKPDSEPKPSLFKRVGRITLRIGLTIGVAVAAVVAVQAGNAELNRRANAAPLPESALTMPVSTAPITLEAGYQITRAFVGQIEPQRTVAVSFELSGQLDSILVDEGDRVVAGQHLATLDTRMLHADRDRLIASGDALKAQLRFASLTVERQSELSGLGFASQAGLDEALSRSDELRARIAEVEAALVTNAIQIEKSVVSAPFAGTVTERFVDGAESMSPGQTIVGIVQDGAPQMRIGVPLDVTVSELARAEVSIAGKTYAAALVSLRPDVDPVTRTRTALFAVQSDDEIAFGQTARLLLSDMVETPGIWVPVTTLKEGLRGQWTLLGVDTDNVVRAMTVQVQYTKDDRVFVTGAFPEGTQLIASGPQRVTVGQTVDPQQIAQLNP